MMITLDTLRSRYDLNFTGVLHVGAHFAEEANDYDRIGIKNVWWVEANAALIPIIRKNLLSYPTHQIVQALVYDQDGVDLGFNITNIEGMSSSILPFGTHKLRAPQVVFERREVLTTKRIDTLVEEHGITGVNFLVMDIQGAELWALMGAEKFLSGVEYVYTEINVDELYLGCARLWELDAFLWERGFLRVETSMADGRVGWGDALYIRKPA